MQQECREEKHERRVQIFIFSSTWKHVFLSFLPAAPFPAPSVNHLIRWVSCVIIPSPSVRCWEEDRTQLRPSTLQRRTLGMALLWHPGPERVLLTCSWSVTSLKWANKEPLGDCLKLSNFYDSNLKACHVYRLWNYRTQLVLHCTQVLQFRHFLCLMTSYSATSVSTAAMRQLEIGCSVFGLKSLKS